MDLLFTFSDGTTNTSEFILDGAKLTECFHSGLKSVDNSFSVKVPFNEILCDELKSDISNNIKVNVRDDNEDNIFTGYVRKTLTFTKTQRNQPFSLEIVPPSFLMDYDYSGTANVTTGVTVATVVSNLIGLTPYEGNIDVSAMNGETMEIFTLSDGDNILSVIKELLFEYCYVFNFDADGNFIVSELFATVPSSITQHFDGANCLNQIQQQVKETSYTQVAVNWDKVEALSNVLIFEDTSGADSTYPAYIEIPAESYYLDEENNYLEYDSKYQDVLWITTTSRTINYDDDSTITESFSNLGTKGDLSIYNSSTSSRYITQLEIYGSGYFETATNTTKTGSDGTLEEIDAKYIQSSTYATILAKALKDYYAYANFTLTLQSKDVYDLGSYCDVSDSGMGTVVCRIVKRAWDVRTNTYEYTLESITDYDPAELVTSYCNTHSKKDNGETLRSAVSDLNTKVDNIVVDTTICSADKTQAIINLDSEGYTIESQQISTTISLRQSSEELDFIFGSMSLPDGWTYSVDGKTLTFTVGEGVKVRSGQILIPIIYHAITSLEEYEDENGEAYVDEDGETYYNVEYSSSYTQWKLYFTYFGDNGGVYLGIISDLDDIPTSLNFGDYFVWGGATTESSLSYDGEFLTSRLYKYIGTGKTWQWEEDTSSEHNAVALGDILSITNTDLATNNSTAYEYLDHLTSNSIFTDLLVANTAYVENLVSTIIDADLIDVDTLLARDVTIQSGGCIHSANYDGTIDADTGEITDYGDKGWCIDNTGQADFVDIHATGGTFTDVNISGSISSSVLSFDYEETTVIQKHGFYIGFIYGQITVYSQTTRSLLAVIVTTTGANVSTATFTTTPHAIWVNDGVTITTAEVTNKIGTNTYPAVQCTSEYDTIKMSLLNVL